jgi:hypothetical protein
VSVGSILAVRTVVAERDDRNCGSFEVVTSQRFRFTTPKADSFTLHRTILLGCGQLGRISQRSEAENGEPHRRGKI